MGSSGFWGDCRASREVEGIAEVEMEECWRLRLEGLEGPARKPDGVRFLAEASSASSLAIESSLKALAFRRFSS